MIRLCVTFISVLFICSILHLPFPAAAADNATSAEQANIAELRALLERTGVLTDKAPQNFLPLTPLDTARLILTRNLAVQDSEIGQKYAAQALREAESLFDPVLRASVGYYNGVTYSRTEEDDKYLKNTVSIDGSDPVYVTYGDSSPIKYLRFDRERTAGYYERNIKAVDPEPWRGGETIDYSAGLSSDLFWGPSLDFSLLLREQKNHWLNDDGSWGDYERPFRSEFREHLSLPLPWTKNFGPDSEKDADVRQQEILSDASKWSLRAAVNDGLLSGELAYWDLVSALLRLDALLKYHDNLLVLLQKTERLYADRMCTEYDLALVKSSLTSAEDSIEQGAASYAAASNALTDLTDYGNATIFIPDGFAVLPNMLSAPLPGESTPSDVNANPSLEYRKAVLASAEVGRLKYENQARPNLRFNQYFLMTQGNALFGYGHAEYSLANVFTSPDLIRQDYGLLYTYPLLNRAADARYEQAVLDLETEQVRTKQLENSLRREAADALALLAGARKRIKITAEEVRLARTAYDKAFDMQADREVTEFEILSKNSALLNARLSHIAARIDGMKSAARFQAAAGTFQDRYAVDPEAITASQPEDPS